MTTLTHVSEAKMAIRLFLTNEREVYADMDIRLDKDAFNWLRENSCQSALKNDPL